MFSRHGHRQTTPISSRHSSHHGECRELICFRRVQRVGENTRPPSVQTNSRSVDETPNGSWELGELLLAHTLATVRSPSPGGLAGLSTRLLDAEHYVHARPTLTICC